MNPNKNLTYLIRIGISNNLGYGIAADITERTA